MAITRWAPGLGTSALIVAALVVAAAAIPRSLMQADGNIAPRKGHIGGHSPEVESILHRHYTDSKSVLRVEPGRRMLVSQPPGYRKRATALKGTIEIWAFDGQVKDESVDRLVFLINHMFAFTPKHMLDRLALHKPVVDIVGINQDITDMPAMEGYDKEKYRGVPGVGPSVEIPHTLVPEYDLDGSDATWGGAYDAAVKSGIYDMGESSDAVVAALATSSAAALFPLDSLALHNSDEYWAVLTQIYFSARYDGGEDKLYDQERLRERQPDALEILDMAYGGNPWRLPQDCKPCVGSDFWDEIYKTKQYPGTISYKGRNKCDVPVATSGCQDVGDESYETPALLCPEMAAQKSGWYVPKYACSGAEYSDYMNKTWCGKACGYCSASGCQDYKSECAQWAKDGNCMYNAEWTNYMFDWCPQSCGFCGGQFCADLHAECPFWGSEGDCTKGVRSPPPAKSPPPLRSPPSLTAPAKPPGYTAYATCEDASGYWSCPGWAMAGWCGKDAATTDKYCTQSCGKCGAPKPTCSDLQSSCPYWASEGYCDSDEEYVKTYCRVSCGYCSVSTSTCKDANTYCAAWAKAGHCETNESWYYMYRFCPRSCGFCGNGQGQDEWSSRR
ncbi:hypothetical protein HYH03_011780 [Edaphochlamys debaryana]|uniref:ShKT domain-containing protein n=1 Tax=Edaphochlamys debaryana TaxID=47281 RepID=A0A836BW28_9CHLO|nr:hypothetical protein HYH03_011780 [Edaphochlamys debaryana]|eukprot:KAG2489669.1 hypothetical protein HYH03_011780 [Edaphochlamys debaryana]